MTVKASSSEAEQGKPKAKRAYHTKSRSGCKTCKIRRLRCDEAKPSCVRCVSTGRKCDGYATDAPPYMAADGAHAQAQAPPQAALLPQAAVVALAPTRLQAQPRVPMPRSSPAELRCFRYFLEVSARSFAGVFDTDFWVRQIPQACHADPAVWHATVSLGALQELSASIPDDSTNKPLKELAIGSQDPRMLFAVQQFNASISHLIRMPRRPGEDDRWRALTASILYTYICSIQGLLKQALVHLEAGTKLLGELETEATSRRINRDKQEPLRSKTASALPSPASEVGDDSFRSSSGSPDPPTSGLPAFKSSPVSLELLHSVITRIEIGTRAINQGGLTKQTGFVAMSDSFSAWRYYQCPNLSAAQAGGGHLISTPENVTRAGRAVESLLNGLVVFSQEVAADLTSVVLRQPGFVEKWTNIIARQESLFRRAFAELGAALRAFEAEMGPGKGLERSGDMRKRIAVNTVRIYHISCRLALFHDTELPDPLERARHLPEQFESIVDLAEEILEADASMIKRHGHGAADTSEASFPASSTTNPLFVTAHGGSSPAIRRRAIDLMRRYPQRDGGGLWHGRFTARIAELVTEREDQARAELLAAGGDSDEAAAAHVMARIHSIRLAHLGERDAVLVMATFSDFVAGKKGKEIVLKW